MIRRRLGRLGDAALNLFGEIPLLGSVVVRSIDQARARARHEQLEVELAAANAEIARLRDGLGIIQERREREELDEMFRELDRLANRFR